MYDGFPYVYNYMYKQGECTMDSPMFITTCISTENVRWIPLCL